MRSAVIVRGVNSCLSTLSVEPKYRSTKLSSSMPGSPARPILAYWRGMRGALTLAVLSAFLLIAFQPAHAQTETVLYSFGSQAGDGYGPWAGLIRIPIGELYGTTVGGGAYGYGTVFRVPSAGQEIVLYNFGTQSGDGAYPYAGVIMDKKSNLYGTTWSGGADNAGTVFKLTGMLEETVLYSFCSQEGCADGAYPYAGVIMDKKSNLYGTTRSGGADNNGTVFKVTPTGAETVLYSFCSQPGCSDGANPLAGVIMDTKGNLYGTTPLGGANNNGTVFKLSSTGGETVLYSFCSQSGCSDGSNPNAGVIMDKKGNLYGTTSGGGYGYGTVFKLSSTGTETVLYSFTNGYTDGQEPYAGPVMGKKGNLYGASSYGPSGNYGALFELSPPRKKGGAWTFTSLHAFNSGSGDGLEPFGTPILDGEGNVYGTTFQGGAYGYGTVWKVTP